MFKRLNAKLITVFTVLIVLILGAVSTATYTVTKGQIEEDVELQATTSVEDIKDEVNQYLGSNAVNINRYSDSKLLQEFLTQEKLVETNTVKKTTTWEDVDQDYQRYLEEFPNVSVVYVGSSATKGMYTTPDLNLSSDYDPTTRPWYQVAIANPDKVNYTEPYIDAATGDYVVTISKAIMDKKTSKPIGVVAADLDLSGLSKVISKTEVGYEGYAFLTDSKGIALVHPTEKGKDLSKLDFMKDLYSGTSEKGLMNYTYDGAKRVMGYDTVENTNWKIGTVYLDSKLYESAGQVLFLILVISIIAIIAAFIVTYLISKTITKPIVGITNEMNKVANGDLTASLRATSKDEVGQLTIHFNTMVEQMKGLILKVNQSVRDVNESAISLSAVAEETTASSQEIGRAITEISAGATQTAQDAEMTNQKTASLAEQLDIVNEHTVQMNTLSKQASETSAQGMEQVSSLRVKTNESNHVLNEIGVVIKGLLDKVKEIENIIGTINDISEQTNLLALNASIEAARAGEHGKGFAVVAEEVRKLAEQSSRATNQVRQTISGINQETVKATEAISQTAAIAGEQGKVVQDTESVFASITSTIDTMVSFIDEIGHEVQHMNEHKENVMASIESISAVAQESAAATEEVTASTEEQIRAISTIADSAEKLNEASEELKNMINHFKL